MKLVDLTVSFLDAIMAMILVIRRMFNMVEVNNRLESMIWYITELSENHCVPLTKTKMNKLLFLSDFASYKLMGCSISGEKYYKNHYGPTIDIKHLEPAINIIGSRIINNNNFDYPKLIIMSPMSLSLSEDDKNLIQKVVNEFQNYSASMLSELTHKFLGWKYAQNDMEEIPYETSLLSKRKLTNLEMKKARKYAHVARKYLSVH